jgi:MFS family permease
LLGRNVIALTAVSFFTDVSSEMIYPLLPVFLTATLGASAGMLGTIEGAAETTASLLKLASGWWSDRVKRRKPLIVAGYAIASLVRPLVAIAQSATQVLAIRVTDRVGKGIRNAPRDALIADSVDPSIRGRAFGFHKAGDHAGAFLGPLIAFGMLTWAGTAVRTVFWLAAIPGALAVVTAVVFVREGVMRQYAVANGGESSGPAETAEAYRESAARSAAAQNALRQSALPPVFWKYIAVFLLFTLGSSSDAFLLLRANQLGVPIALAPILWAALHAVKSLASTPGGALSDRVGRVPTLLAGWTLYALVYVGFAFASVAWHAWALFLAYGLFFALTEGAERALVADIVPAARRGTAFGWFNLTTGLGLLPASVVFGLVWDRWGASTAFMMGSAIAAAACLSLALLPKPRALQA